MKVKFNEILLKYQIILDSSFLCILIEEAIIRGILIFNIIDFNYINYINYIDLHPLLLLGLTIHEKLLSTLNTLITTST